MITKKIKKLISHLNTLSILTKNFRRHIQKGYEYPKQQQIQQNKILIITNQINSDLVFLEYYRKIGGITRKEFQEINKQIQRFNSLKEEYETITKYRSYSSRTKTR